MPVFAPADDDKRRDKHVGLPSVVLSDAGSIPAASTQYLVGLVRDFGCARTRFLPQVPDRQFGGHVDGSFSRRHGFVATSVPITIREDAPEFLRASLLLLASEENLSPDELRSAVCGVLRVLPDRNNWSAGNVWSEAEGLIASCDW